MPKLAAVNGRGNSFEASESAASPRIYFSEGRGSPNRSPSPEPPGRPFRPPSLPIGSMASGSGKPPSPVPGLPLGQQRSTAGSKEKEVPLSARSRGWGTSTPRQTGSSGLTPRPNRLEAAKGSTQPPMSSPRDQESFVSEVRRISRCNSTDYRKVLGVAPGTTDMQALQARYRLLMRLLHPDKRSEEEEAMVGGKGVCDEAVTMVTKAMQAARQGRGGEQDKNAATDESKVRQPEESPDVVVGMSPRGSPRGGMRSPRGHEDRVPYTPRSARTRPQETPRRTAPGPSGGGTSPQSPPGVREEREEQVFGNGARYVGQWCGDQQDGEGIVTLPDGSQYRGQFVRGMAHGAGSFTTSGGDKYQGQWHSDQASGTGQYWGSDGRTYSGQWEGDTQHGHGTEISADGTRYEGDFRKGLKHGVGKFVWKDGSVYDGQFNNNMIHGFGIYVWANGRRYEGQWSKEKMHGHGKYTFPSGCAYVGQYKDDLKAGTGTFTWTDGHVYTGQWDYGKQDGQGTMTSPDGNVRTGVWQAGRRVDPTSKGVAQASPRGQRTPAPCSPRDATREPVPWSPRTPNVEEFATPHSVGSCSPNLGSPSCSPGATPRGASRMTSIFSGFAAAASPFSARGQASPLGIPSLMRARSPAHKPRKNFVQPQRPQDPDSTIEI